jgi:hypothetical protein
MKSVVKACAVALLAVVLLTEAVVIAAELHIHYGIFWK